jgi:phage gp45-like
MEIEIGTVNGQEIERDNDAENNTLVLRLEIIEDDVQNVEMYRQPGDYSNPPEEAQALIIPVSEDYKLAIAFDDNVEPDSTIEPGEKLLYSSENGQVKALIQLKKDGSIGINTQDQNDFAVRYNQLQVAFDELKQNFNDLITLFNAHVHSGVTTGPGSSGPPASPGTPSSADITKSKIENVYVEEYTP